MQRACRICGNREGNRSHTAREMMFGWRDRFEYFECDECGCVQIVEVPDDLERHYPPEYYSFRPLAPWSGVGRRLRERRLRSTIRPGSGGWIGRLLVALRGPRPFGEWLRRAGVEESDAILDVGAGQGGLVRELRLAGFDLARGIDPYLPPGATRDPDAVVDRISLEEVDGTFRLIMFHHVFEHVADPEGALRAARRILTDDGTVLIRIPVADSNAWERYGVDWVQLDPPRHLFLHTTKSLEILAERAGLEVREVRYDSTGFQFWGSEQYRQDLPLIAVDDERRHPLFSRREMRRFDREADELNRTGRGDQAAFYLTPKHDG